MVDGIKVFVHAHHGEKYEANVVVCTNVGTMYQPGKQDLLIA